MKKLLVLFVFANFMISCNGSLKDKNFKRPVQNISMDSTDKASFGIVIHGGAGSIYEKNMSDSLRTAYKTKLEEAVRTGYEILASGGTSVDAVRETIKVLENSPLFNAGKGAVFTHDGTNEMDASIMNGRNLKAGAIAGVTTVKNPIDLAYQVMVNSPHVMLYGKGAEEFAELQGVEQVDPSYFFTKKRFEGLQRVKAAEKAKRNE